MIQADKESEPRHMSQPMLSIIVPAYNEEARIGETVTEILAYLRGRPFTWEVIVVDDGSSDRTREIVEDLAAGAGEPLQVILAPHRGKGGAVRRGMLAASGAYRFMADADMAMPIAQLDRFLDRMKEGHDVVIGSREAAGARRFDEPTSRHLIGRVFNWLVRLLAVRGFQDTQCGFKCFTGAAAEALFGMMRTNGFGFDVEMLYLAKRLRLSVIEIPIDWHYQSCSKVKPLRDSLLMLRDIAGIRLRSLAGRYDA